MKSIKYVLINKKIRLEKNLGHLLSRGGIIEKISYGLYLKWSIYKVRINIKSGADVFIFFTDSHWGANDCNSPTICKEMATKCGIEKIVFGGDIITDSYPEKKNAVFEIREFFRSFESNKYRLFPVVGNHDYNTYMQTNQFASISGKELKQLLNQSVPHLCEHRKNFYYKDNATSYVRYIFLNTADELFIEEQISFVCETLISTPDNYKIVIFGHIWVEWDKTARKYYPNKSTKELLNIFDRYNDRRSYNTYEFKAASSRIILVMGGHIHNEYSFYTKGGIPVVLKDSDCRMKSCNHKNLCIEHTPWEQSLSVVIITDMKLKILNIGRGNSEVFYYNW